ncbi:hypothetical protein HS096_06690 [candidate division WWE3 bacterium]|uniref:Uncharacterized protein n=1 Tax=candidate division WWE3 bacterium TaxID=2053526 RepID=A0A928Y6A8_UNCKA|nr:hypothetical protein [candidate division WWE3 bacterium]
MILISPKEHTPEWLKYLAIALICALVAVDGIGSVMADQVKTSTQQTNTSDSADEPRLVIHSDSVASRLGGYYGILAFCIIMPCLHYCPIVKLPRFRQSDGNSADIAQCLAMMLDHDLGGSSRHDGTVLDTGHKCRGSMPKIHKGGTFPIKPSQNLFRSSVNKPSWPV